MACEWQTASVAVLFTAETEAGIKVRQVVNQLVQWIGFVIERRADGETVFLMEKAHDPPAQGRHAAGVHQAKPTPQHGDARGGVQVSADSGERATDALFRKDLTFDGPMKRNTVGID